MKTLGYYSRASGLCIVALALSSCTSQQAGPPGVGGYDGATLQERLNLAPRQLAIRRGTSGQDLLYISAAGRGDVYVFTYPEGKLVGTVSGLLEPAWECSDSAGDIFITAWSDPSFSSSVIYEYAHGGTTPIATLSDPGKASGCSIDSTTGALAVANGADSSNPYGSTYGDVAVYTAAHGTPTIYYSSEYNFGFCGYDGSGSLYLMGYTSAHGNQLVRLAAGSASFEAIEVNKQIHSSPQTSPSVQWDGTHMTVSSAAYPQGRKGAGTVSVYRLSISGTSATVIGTTKLLSKGNRHGGQSWIQGNRIIGLDYHKGFWNATFWPYPAGGKAPFSVKKILATNKGSLAGVTVSVASSR